MIADLLKAFGTSNRRGDRPSARLSVVQLERRDTPSIINVGAAGPDYGSVYDDGLINPVTQLANGEYLAADLSDAIGFANTLPPQGGNGVGPADPVGPHLIYVNREYIFLTDRLPTLVPQTIIRGNSAQSTMVYSENYNYEPPLMSFTRTPTEVKATIQRGDFNSRDQFGNVVEDFRILHAISPWLELRHLRMGGGRETDGTTEQTRHGGIIQFDGVDLPLIVDHCYMFAGYAIGNGGAIYSPMRGMTITNSYFSGNLTNGSGGAIWMNTPSAQGLTIANTAFNSNYALGDGGSIWVSTLGVVGIDGCAFTDSFAVGYGGSLYVQTSNTVDIAATVFDDTTGLDGGAIYINDTVYFQVRNSMIINPYNGNWDIDAIFANVRMGWSISGSLIEGEIVINGEIIQP
jgi:hypothetical protein